MAKAAAPFLHPRLARACLARVVLLLIAAYGAYWSWRAVDDQRWTATVTNGDPRTRRRSPWRMSVLRTPQASTSAPFPFMRAIGRALRDFAVRSGLGSFAAGTNFSAILPRPIPR